MSIASLEFILLPGSDTAAFCAQKEWSYLGEAGWPVVIGDAEEEDSVVGQSGVVQVVCNQDYEVIKLYRLSATVSPAASR